MIEKIADDLIGQMTEARLIDKEMEARYVYVFICWIEKFITVDVSQAAPNYIFSCVFFRIKKENWRISSGQVL